MFPWGIASTQNLTTLREGDESFSAPHQMRVTTEQMIGDEFENRCANKVTTLVTPKTVSWIVTQPLKADYSQYFVNELLTQLLVSLLLAKLLWLTRSLTFTQRILIIAVVGCMSGAATYGQLMNWWALPPAYALGVSFNLLCGWLIAGAVSAKFVLPMSVQCSSETE